MLSLSYIGSILGYVSQVTRYQDKPFLDLVYPLLINMADSVSSVQVCRVPPILGSTSSKTRWEVMLVHQLLTF